MDQKQVATTSEAAAKSSRSIGAHYSAAPESASLDLNELFLHRLHQTAGNRTVGRWLQTKLKVGAPNDPYEQEADRVADQVMRMPEPGVQRKCAACENGNGACAGCEQEESVQRTPSASPSFPAMHKPLTTGGSTIAAETRAFFESRMGHDFSQVRVHTDAEAAQSASAFAARAYTFGRNIVFAAGEYRPGTESGKHLLAHELTHVAQQANPQMGDDFVIRRMPACPSHLEDTDPTPAGWQAYHGDTSWFHCGFRVILEDRNPTPSDPQNECAYDHSGTLVDENHPYAGCRGTPNQYDSKQHPLDHTFSDSGGIWEAGGPAFVTSRIYTLSRPIAAAIKVVTTAGRIIRSVTDGFGRLIALGILAASASVDPANWRFQGLPARSVRHLNVMGALLGSAALSQNVDTLLKNLTRRLDSFSIAGLLDEIAQDVNQTLTNRGATAQLVVPSDLGVLSVIQLVEWLRVQGILQYMRPPEDIAREQFEAQSAASPGQ